MWFSKRTNREGDAKPAVDPQAKRRAQAIVVAPLQRTQPVEPTAIAAVVADPTLPNLRREVVLTDIDKLPGDGKYQPFGSYAGGSIPRDYERTFAVLKCADEGGRQPVYLLRTEDVVRQRAEFDIVQRCQMIGWTVREKITVSAEVLKALHLKHHKAAENHNERELSDTQRIAFALVESAVEMGASDIHIATRENKAEVFFRIHGERLAQPDFARETAIDVMRVLYNVHADAQNSGTNWDQSKVMDTAIEHSIEGMDGGKVQLRFNSAPIYPGDNVQCTMRVLRMDGAQSAKEIEEVGYTPEMVKAIEEMLIGSTGLVLLVGPTNSGKSTSTQSFIKRIYQRRGKNIKVVTIEDPVEYVIAAACQMGVPRGKLEEEQIRTIYSQLLSSTLRQDPDVALVGEIRTSEQAEPVKDMVLAGRKILSTLHAYEAMAVFPRLREIGIPESLLTRAGFVSGVIYQRLVPLLCQKCSEPLTVDMIAERRIMQSTFDRVMSVTDDTHVVRLRKPGGCAHCGYTGIVGRTPCAEILVPDETFLRLVREGKEREAKNYWYSTGINTDGAGVRAVAHAISKMRQGLVDPNDVESQINKIEITRPEPDPVGLSGSDYAAAGHRSGGYEVATDDLLGRSGRNGAFGGMGAASAHRI